LQSRQYGGYRSDTNAIRGRDLVREALARNLFHMVKNIRPDDPAVLIAISRAG
jgi:hypothetical protein